MLIKGWIFVHFVALKLLFPSERALEPDKFDGLTAIPDCFVFAKWED
jgi:hypothetical protein